MKKSQFDEVEEGLEEDEEQNQIDIKFEKISLNKMKTLSQCLRESIQDSIDEFRLDTPNKRNQIFYMVQSSLHQSLLLNSIISSFELLSSNYSNLNNNDQIREIFYMFNFISLSLKNLNEIYFKSIKENFEIINEYLIQPIQEGIESLEHRMQKYLKGAKQGKGYQLLNSEIINDKLIKEKELNSEKNEKIKELYKKYANAKTNSFVEWYGKYTNLAESEMNEIRNNHLVQFLNGNLYQTIPAQYIFDFLDLGLEFDLPEAICMGEQALGKMNMILPYNLALRLVHYRINNSEKMLNARKITGPVALNEIYTEVSHIYPFMCQSSEEEIQQKINEGKIWLQPSVLKSDYNKYKWIEGIIPKIILENIQEKY